MANNEAEAPSRQVMRAQARAAAKGGGNRARASQAAANRDPAEKPAKGLFDGNCNRTACQVTIKGDNWFNMSTRAYYCRRCAHLINTDAVRFDGMRICMPVEDADDRPPFPYEEMERIRAERMRARAG